jgi:hypothetical protein
LVPLGGIIRHSSTVIPLPEFARRLFSHGKSVKLPLRSLLSLVVAFGASGASVDYVREVKPIFAEHCYRCHGASQHKSELRMDTVAFALKGGDNGPAFKAGKSAESLIVKLLKGTHPDLARMPYKKPPLSDAPMCGQVSSMAKKCRPWQKTATNLVPTASRPVRTLQAASPSLRCRRSPSCGGSRSDVCCGWWHVTVRRPANPPFHGHADFGTRPFTALARAPYVMRP